VRSVTVRNGNVDAALRVFKRKVNNSEVLMEYRERQTYTKRSSHKQRKKQAAIVRERKRQQND